MRNPVIASDIFDNRYLVTALYLEFKAIIYLSSFPGIGKCTG